MRFIIIESPYAGDETEQLDNLLYARACLLDSLKRGEAPFASHLLYPQVLRDEYPDEREQGIEAGLAIGSKADLTAVYVDRGVSPGMKTGIKRAERELRPVIYRRLFKHGEKCAVWNLERCTCGALEGAE